MFNNHDHISFYDTSEDHFIKDYYNQVPHNINCNNHIKEEYYLNQHNLNKISEKKQKHFTNSDFSVLFNLQEKKTYSSPLNTEKNHTSLSINQELKNLKAIRKMSMEISPDLELPFTSIISIASNIYEKNNISENSFSKYTSKNIFHLVNYISPTQLNLNILLEKQKHLGHEFKKHRIPYETLDSRYKNVNNSIFPIQEHFFSNPIVFEKSNIKNSHINFNSKNELHKSISQTQIPYSFKNDKHISIHRPRLTFKRSFDIKVQTSSQNSDYTITSFKKDPQNTLMLSQEVDMSKFVFSDPNFIKKNHNYTETMNTTNKALHNRDNEVFLSYQTQNKYNNFNLLKHKKNNVILSYPTKHYYKDNDLPPIPYRKSFRNSQSKIYSHIPLLSNNERLYHNLPSLPLSPKDYQINNSYEYTANLSDSGTKMHNQLNFSKKSSWEMFFNYENDDYLNSKNKEPKKDRIKHANNKNLDVAQANETSAKYLNIIKNHKSEYNFLSLKYNFIKKENIKNILLFISDYKKKLLDKKTYFSQVSKYFFTKYLKGKKSTNEYSNYFQHESLYFTRFPIRFERAIYHLARIKLSDPHRPLYQQVLLANFMCYYLSLVKKDQIMQHSGNKLHESITTSPTFQYDIIHRTMQNQIEKNIGFPIKESFKKNAYNGNLINGSIDQKYKTHIPYLINSLDPTIFDYSDLNMPFAYDDYDEEFSDIQSILYKNNNLYYNQLDSNKNILNSDILDSDILNPDIPIIKNIHNTLYI
ncbi:hypothetical protein PMAC_001941 [Pneumocystis sp. 'macacae']|nr:hypothetical protein PMAC_001941 [Pneumocystis sp. 'macacae']